MDQNNNNNNNNNVIEFPKFKSIRVLEKYKTSRFDLEQRKVALSASIASILFVITFANSNLFKSGAQDQVQSANRIPASVSSTERNPEWEHKLAKRLSKLHLRSVASIGQRPSLEDKLRFEELQGKYAIRFQGENRYISEIEFTKLDPDAKARPRLLGDSKKFLLDYRDLMPNFETLEQSTDYTNDNPSYTLVDAGKKVAQVDFQLDRFGRLLKLKVVPIEL
ncbi:MAG: hypothetical protein R2827_12385 [Bdellovibrionales bacterium]